MNKQEAPRQYRLTPGQEFTRWRVVAHDVATMGRMVRVECRGSAENPHLPVQRDLSASSLVLEKTRSCGCLSAELAAARLRGAAGRAVRAQARAHRAERGIVPRAQARESPARVQADRARVAALRAEARALAKTSPRVLVAAELRAVLGDGEGRSTAEVAEALGLSIATAAARLKRHPALVQRGADRLWRIR